MAPGALEAPTPPREGRLRTGAHSLEPTQGSTGGRDGVGNLCKGADVDALLGTWRGAPRAWATLAAGSHLDAVSPWRPECKPCEDAWGISEQPGKKEELFKWGRGQA